MALELDDQDLLRILDTYHCAIFAQQCPTDEPNGAALRKLVSEARSRGLDLSPFSELGWLTGERDPGDGPRP